MKLRIILSLAVCLIVMAPLAQCQQEPVSAQPGLSEVTELRTETSKTYYLGNDQYELISTGPLHYKDAQGTWQQIDNAIIGDQMLTDAYELRILQDTFNAGQILEWSVEGEWVRFQPMPLQWTNDLAQIQQISIPQAVAGSVVNTPMPLVKEGDGYIQGKVVWADAYGPGIDFQWAATPHRLEKQLTLDSSLPAPAQWILDGGNPALRLSFIFDPSPGIDVYVDNVLWDKSSQVSTFNALECRKAGELLWIFDPVSFWDSSGEPQAGQAALRKVGNSLWLDILVPYEWLETAAYPVTVDPTLTAYSSDSDGRCFKFDPVYNTCWTSTTGSAEYSLDYTKIGQYQSSVPAWYNIFRSFFFFDTSSIGESGEIESATLNLYGKTDQSVVDFDITIQDGQPTYPHDPLVSGDYNKAHYSGDGNDTFNTASFSTGAYNVITLDADGESWINKTGDTKLCVRSAREISGTAPGSPDNPEWVDVYTTDYTGTSRDPYLYIIYTAGDPPTVTTNAATNVEDTTATLNGQVDAINDTEITERGFVWDTSSHGDPGDTAPSGSDYANYWTEAGSWGTGSFSHGVTSLATATLHYFRAAAENDVPLWAYGSELTFLTKPAAPTNVAATDGDHTDKVVITWTKSTGTVTGYKIYGDGDLLDTVGDVATYDHTGAPAPTITPGSASASDGTYSEYTKLTVSGHSANNGATMTYKVRAYNDSGDSDDSATDTGYRGVGALGYQWQESSGDAPSGFTDIPGGTTNPYDHTGAPAPTITPGSATATDGSSSTIVALTVSGHSSNDGAGRYYQCELSAAGATNQTSSSDRGYRGVGALGYQWQESSDDIDYSDILGATTNPYDHTGAPAPTITPGNATATDGSSAYHVTLTLSGHFASNGTINYYQCELSAAGATNQTSSSDSGHRGTAALSYQWERSAADSDADYSSISGATANPYDDTDGAVDPDGRYYQCDVSMAGATNQTSSSDRGYRDLPDIPTVTAQDATAISGAGALLHGNITSTGGDNASTIGFEWGYSTGNYTHNWTDTGDFGQGTFQRRISGIPITTQVFWRAFAINDAGRGNSTEQDFWTLALPDPPTDLTITHVLGHTYNISWTKGAGALDTTIMVSGSGYPATVNDGLLIYSGNGTWVIVDGINTDLFNYYYSGWSSNEHGYSTAHAEASLANPLGVAQVMFVIGLCIFAFWKKSWIRVLLAICIIIWGVFALPYNVNIAAPLVATGSILFIIGIINLMGWQLRLPERAQRYLERYRPRWGER